MRRAFCFTRKSKFPVKSTDYLSKMKKTRENKTKKLSFRQAALCSVDIDHVVNKWYNNLTEKQLR